MSCREPGSNAYARGIDVSRWQGEIDWARVAAAGVTHGVAKMSEGATYADPRFVENFRGMRANGLQAGAYHYFRALNCTPGEQLANIRDRLAAVDFEVGRDLFAIDVEARYNEQATPEQMADGLFQLVRLVRELHGGAHPVIYTAAGFWDRQVAWQSYDFSECPLWVAHWQVDEPVLPQSWRCRGLGWRWWQHSSKGLVDGIQGEVDLDWVTV
ncbi:glycoside hydrolase family 25 protein [Pseudomonas asplenii]|uniref:glycoside hydrolase family 25 protein n=1 Tax=Pseudomonas asplenii TaxID=53407 RepID=UPI0006B5752A|nr:glycoside hydrolase family 25 protein [Pseudomonas fuscovaginae]KPA97779.1 lysozyme M1 (1,4-beta-N-acetylmuramidase) [Pseudomonas fuscovaginae]